jgi:hypothetical protein
MAGTAATVDARAKRYGNAAMMTLDLERAVRLLGVSMTDALGKIAADLCRYTILNTPVDTGAAANNWQFSRGEPDPGTDPLATSEAESAASREVARTIALVQLGPPGTNRWWLANGLPYIERLEFGWSKKSPAGMARIAVARVSAEIEDAMERAAAANGLGL